MNLNLFKARPGTGRISTARGQYVPAQLVSTIFSRLTVRDVQSADRWLQTLARGWAASAADLEVYIRLSDMIQGLLRAAALACRVAPSRLGRIMREAFARKMHRKQQEETVRHFFEEGLAPDYFAASQDVLDVWSVAFYRRGDFLVAYHLA